MFYMGDDGLATFESENDADEDRTWETSRETRRKRRTVNARSRRNTGRSRRGTEEAGQEVELKNIMGEAKAETVAALLALEAELMNGE